MVSCLIALGFRLEQYSVVSIVNSLLPNGSPPFIPTVIIVFSQDGGEEPGTVSRF